MPSIRRYGPALVSPQVAPRPELGRGREQTFAAFQSILGAAQEYLRPAVEHVQTVRGEQEALGEVREKGPEWGLRMLRGEGTKVTMGRSDVTGPPVGPTRVNAAILKAGKAHGVDPGILSVIADLESGFDPNAKNPTSSAGGLFQFIDSTASAYGLSDRFNVDAAADAGARLARDNINALAGALGRQPTVGEIYLAHQQGAQGAINLLTAPAPVLASSVVGREAVRLNGGNPDTMSARDFAALWVDKANAKAGAGPGKPQSTDLVPGLKNIDYSATGTRDKPLKPELVAQLNSVIKALGPDMDVRVTSAGQPSADEAGEGERTGSVRHDHGGAVDVVLVRNGKQVTPGQDPELYERFFSLGSQFFTGMGHYAWGAHVGGGAPAFWGPDTTSDTADPRFAAAAANGRGGVTITVPDVPEYELETLNNSTFEPRIPFSIRDAAFNKAADRVIGARASAAMEEGLRAAMSRADGDIGVLREEMEKVRSQVMSELPTELPGLATELQAQFDRGRLVAERQSVELAQRRVIQRQEAALGQIVSTTQSEAERLALTGATAAELADHMAQATDVLARFGPREGFEIAGRYYPPDPTRAGTVTADAIAENMAKIGTEARRLMIEADFMKSEAPGQYAAEFRDQLFAGNSPLPAGESITLLRRMESSARASESARRTAAEAERRRLEKGMTETINAYVSMTEAGVPVAIPQEERARILSALAPYPDLQRQAEIEFQVADAAVATHGMTGDELMAYVERIRTDMSSAVERGELDLGGAAIIESLQDRVKQVRDAVSAETIGLPLIEQLAMNGALADDVNYDGLREQAAGNPELLRAISEVEGFHRDIEKIKGMSAAEREAVLEQARASLAVLAAKGEGYGAEALMTERVVDRLSEWSDHRRKMADSDPVRFAKSVGVDLPGFEEAETMADVGGIIAQRVELLAPHTGPEGVEFPVPMSQAELDAISETFQSSTRGQRSEFLGAVADLGEEQAMAIFKRIGQSEPVIFAAGAVYSMGNHQAAGVILRGAVDTRLEGGTPTDVAMARETVLAPLLEADMIAPEGIRDLDTTALAYARGLALAEGGRAIEASDLETGYLIALGQQADGTGGMAETRYGTTLLPPSWDRRRVNRAIGGLTDEALTQFARGLVVDRQGRPFTADTLERTIEGLRPSPDDPYVLVPVDAEGNVFLTDDGNQRGVLTFDLREFD